MVPVRPLAALVSAAVASLTIVAQEPTQQPAPTPAPAQASAPEPERPPFVDWLAAVKKEALSRGIREEIVNDALANIEEPLPVIIERDRAQAESVFSLEKYVKRRLTPKFVRAGREVFARNRDLLEEVGETYGVPPQIIAAVWGIESNFGRFSGVRPTIAALATLAYDPRRAKFFRGELFNALEILNEGDIELNSMRGSWAGAMGQVQFMPSSYLGYAEDYDGDGRRDIWSSPADVFASIANYLRGHGWRPGEPWGREIQVSGEVAQHVAAVAHREGTCLATRDMTVAQPLSAWRKLGVRLPGGRPLPSTSVEAAIVAGKTKHYLTYANYDVLLEYNCASAYAITVGLLADRIGAGQTRPPRTTMKVASASPRP